MNSRFPEVQMVPNSELITKVHLPIEQVVARIYSEYVLDIDPIITEALDEINHKRRNRRDGQGNPLREHFSFTRYRLILPPSVNNSFMELHLAPIDFAYVALLRDNHTPPSIKTYIQSRIRTVASSFPPSLRGNHQSLNEYNPVPLGIEMVIVSRDGKTLMRRRGNSVLTGNDYWDVAFSGYCGGRDVVGDTINLGLTSQHELVRELGNLPANPDNIMITGLSRNTMNDSTDVLGYWKVDVLGDQLISLLTNGHPAPTEVFETTKKADEPYVWDTSNLIVDLNSDAISKTFQQIGLETHSLTPEALVCLLLALETVEQK